MKHTHEIAGEIVERHKEIITKAFASLLLSDIELKMYEYGLNEVDRILQIMYADSIDNLRTRGYEDDRSYQEWKRNIIKRLT